MNIIIETERLFLRTWEDKDAHSFFEINQDPQVIEFLRGSLAMEEINQFIHSAKIHQAQLGYGLWAVELKEAAEFIGYIGLRNTDFSEPYGAPFAPAVEVGWRLGSQYWGKGYATEGAKACLDFGFNVIGLDEIVSFTVPMNRRSIRVMEKIGLQHDEKGDFRHPKLALDHLLSQHVLYKLKKKDCLR